jgi:hypothetical protein
LDAREQSDADTLSNLAVFFDVLWEIVDKREIHGGIGRILENLENSAYDSIREEEIISALNRE